MTYSAVMSVEQVQRHVVIGSDVDGDCTIYCYDSFKLNSEWMGWCSTEEVIINHDPKQYYIDAESR
jgi:hypothetical protein